MKSQILFILPSLHAGGTENYALRFCRFYKEEIDFHVISLNQQKGDLYADFEEIGVKIHYLSLGYLHPIKGLAFYQFLRKHKFDIVCAFNGNFGGWALFISYLAKIPKRIVFYRRSTPAFEQSLLKRNYHKWMGSWVRNFATEILSNSEYAFKNFHSKIYQSDQRFQIIYNGVDKSFVEVPETKSYYRRQFSIPQDVFVIGHVGRNDPAKNHETIFKVASKLKQKGIAVHFLFCGKETDSEQFQERIHFHQIEDICTCLGLHQPIGEVYKSMDLFFFPSITEGQPNALIEAVLAKIPMVASRVKPIESLFPTYFRKYMADALDDDLFSRIISELIVENYSIEELSKLFIDKFDQKKNFESFLNYL